MAAQRLLFAQATSALSVDGTFPFNLYKDADVFCDGHFRRRGHQLVFKCSNPFVPRAISSSSGLSAGCWFTPLREERVLRRRMRRMCEPMALRKQLNLRPDPGT